MPRKELEVSELLSRWEVMIAYQECIKPFTPSVRDMVEQWAVNSTAHAAFILKKLVKLGLVTTRKRGQAGQQYYAIQLEGDNNA